MAVAKDFWDLIREWAPEGVTDEAIRRAKRRGYVPHTWRFPIAVAARARGVQLPADFFDIKPKRGGKG